MSIEQKSLTVKPIGFVKNEVTEPEMRDWGKIVSEIVIEPHLNEALDGIEEFSHIIVLFWINKNEPAGQLPPKLHPQGKKELPLVGRFATRSPHRYNPIAKTTVKLLERRGNILRVQGLDAIDGTPVVDIKPYMPHYDSANNARVPQWVEKLHAKSS